MVTISREQAIEAATEALRKNGPTISMSDVARLLKINRRDMYRFFQNTPEMIEIVARHWIYGLRINALKAIYDALPVEECLVDLCDEIVRMQSRGILKGASDELIAAYQSIRLATLQEILEKGRQNHLYTYENVGTVARLFFHVMDDHSRKVLAFHESMGRTDASQKGVNVKLRTDDLKGSYDAVYDLLTLAIGAPTEDPCPVRQRRPMTTAGAH